MAKSDNVIKQEELALVKAIANTLQIFDYEVSLLLDKPMLKIVLKPEGERILQFYRLILEMNIDKHTNIGEINKIRDFGLKMGLPASAIDEVLRMMNAYENEIISLEELMKVFKRHYN